MDKFAEVDSLANDFSKLSKKERKRFKREMEHREERRNEVIKKVRNWVIGLLVIGLLGLGGWWGYKELSKPLPGQQFENQGREHVAREQWEKFAYNSNPPTSGPHDATWVKADVFSTPQPEGQLIHSLEHGYIVLSYNCNSGISNFQFPISNEATGSAEATQSGDLPNPLNQQACDTLKKQLSDLANDKKLWKLIVVPRPNLDVRIALTAWTRLDKINEFDRGRIVAFIDAFRNKGPEQTME